MQEILSQIPIRQDLVSFIMVLGIVQGFLLSAVIALRSSSQNHSLRILGWLLFCLSLICVDVYLCYSGLMKYVLFLNDSTEFIVLMLGPLIFFLIRSLLERQDIEWKKDWIHFILPGIYFLFQWSAMLQGEDFKLNSYIGTYFPDIPRLKLEPNFLWNFFFLRNLDRELNLFSFCLYFFLAGKVIYAHREKIGKGFRNEKSRDKYTFSRNTLLLFLLSGVIILSIYLNYESDLGDHFIIMFISLTIFSTSFFMLSESRLFEKSWIAEKYETSGLNTNQQAILNRVQEVLEEDQYYLQADASLSGLSKSLSLAPNYLSQSINTLLGQNFNEFINSYRIEEAKLRLLDENYSHLSIEGIGNSVGFRSKSAFYTAFKKYTGLTPATFVKENS
ncbi:MAG: helix-turn-helix domain-containing protein [Bacteroidota bacterium]